jgi:tRNA-specific 2-thiouridylase
MENKKIKVLCGMSGGVDSSVSAALLKQQGYEVIGVFMKFWSEEGVESGEDLNKCCSVESYMSAKRVCQILEIPLYTFNFKDAFKEKIVDNFLEEYQVGLTPNPCIRCNQFIKFGMMLEKAKEYGAEYVATGHYAQVQKNNNEYKLLKGVDEQKDQSYFLYTLTQEKLKHILFPVGHLTKPEVRQLAEDFGLPTAQKPDSQELCFINEKNHYNFLQRHLDLKSGEIVDIAGKKLGTHLGLSLYTIGQRKGIEIGGTGPYYVVRLDFKENKLVVSKDQRDLLSDKLSVKNIHWVAGKSPEMPLKCQAKIRYKQQESEAVVDYNKKTLSYDVKFAEPQRAISHGQSLVLYQLDEVLGGGVIL